MVSGYNLPQPKMSNTDLSRLLKSEEIKRVLRHPKYVLLLSSKLDSKIFTFFNDEMSFKLHSEHWVMIPRDLLMTSDPFTKLI